MDVDRRIRLDDRLAHRLPDDAVDRLLTSHEQPARAPELRKKRTGIDNQRVEQTIVKSRAWCDDRAVAVLLAVGKDDEERAQIVRPFVEVDAVLLALVRQALVQAD